MPIHGEFWREEYWSRFARDVWRLFIISNELASILGHDEAAGYVEATALLTKHIVEKLSEYVEVEEPEHPGVTGAMLVSEYMKSLAEYAIGKNPVVTLAWVFRNITFEYARANYEEIREKPERFDYLAEILGLEPVYEPPELLTGGEIDLRLYHAVGHLDNVVFEPGSEHLGGNRFRYVFRIKDMIDYGKASIAALIIRLGMLSWEILHSKPGILSIFETTDARSMYLELASTKIPPLAHEIVETRGINVLGDGKVFYIRSERIDSDASINMEFFSDTYDVNVPMPKACRSAVYRINGPLVYSYDLCLSTDILLKENSYGFGDDARNRLNIVEFLRGIQPYVYLGVWDLVFIDDKILLYTRI